MDTIDEKKNYARLSGYGNGKITVEGIPDKQQEGVQAAFRSGTNWVRVTNGTVELLPALKCIPSPADDDDLLPYWRKNHPDIQAEMHFLELAELREYDSPSIIIQHLCGYHYTPVRYKAIAAKLESYGFECMRSRRGVDGQYWEMWYLPGLFLAKGDLKTEIESGTDRSEKAKLERALEFLRCKTTFGTLDVCVQRLCMPHPD